MANRLGGGRMTKLFKIDDVINFQLEGGTTLKYVCTCKLDNTNIATDIYYREPVLPGCQNRYIGIYLDPQTSEIVTINTGTVGEFIFNLVSDGAGEFQYDIVTNADNNLPHSAKTFVVRDGRFVEKTNLF